MLDFIKDLLDVIYLAICKINPYHTLNHHIANFLYETTKIFILLLKIRCRPMLKINQLEDSDRCRNIMLFFSSSFQAIQRLMDITKSLNISFPAWRETEGILTRVWLAESCWLDGQVYFLPGWNYLQPDLKSLEKSLNDSTEATEWKWLIPFKLTRVLLSIN